MAEAIGEIPVIITGDFSALDDALKNSVIAAELGSSKVSESFKQIETASQTLEDRIQALYQQGFKTLGEAMAEIARQDTPAKITEVADAASKATQEIVPLDQALSDFVSSAGDKGALDALNSALEDFANTAGKQLKPALQEVKPALQDVETEVASLSDRLNTLGQGLRESGKVLSELLTVPLAAAGAALVKVGTDFDQVSNTIRAKIGLVGDDLAAMNASFDAVASSVPNSLGDITTAFTTLETRLGITGDSLEKLSTQMLNLSRITGESIGTIADAAAKVFDRWTIATNDQSAALDKLYYASTQTGTSVTKMLGELRQFAPALQEAGFSFDQAVALLAKFDQAGLNTSRDLTALQQAIQRMGKAGISDPAEGLQLLIDRIKEAGTQGEANAIGLKVFGRGALDLVDAILKDKLNVDDFTKSLGNHSGAINKAAADTLGFTAQLKELRNQFEVAARPAGEAFLKVLEDIISNSGPVVKIVADLADAFHNLSPSAQAAVIGVGALAGITGPLIIGMGLVATQAANLIKLFGSEGALEGVAGAVTAARVAVTGFIASIAGVTTASLTAGIVSTISSLNQLEQKWKDVSQASKNAFILDSIAHGKTLEDLKALGISLSDVKTAMDGTAIKAADATGKFDDFGVKVTTTGTNARAAASGINEHNTAAGHAAQSTDAAKAALDRLISGAGPQKEFWADLKKSYEDWAKSLESNKATTAGAFDAASAAFSNLTRTVILGAKEQGDAFNNWIIAAAKMQSGFGPIAQDIISKQAGLQQTANDTALAFNQIVEKSKESGDAGVAAYNALVPAADNLAKALKAAGMTADDLNVKVKLVGNEGIPVITGGVTKMVDAFGKADPVIAEVNSKLKEIGVSASGITVVANGISKVVEISGAAAKGIDGIKISTDAAASAAGELTGKFDLINTSTQRLKDQVTTLGASIGTSTGYIVEQYSKIDGEVNKVMFGVQNIDSDVKTLIGDTTQQANAFASWFAAVNNTKGAVEATSGSVQVLTSHVTKTTAEINAAIQAANQFPKPFEDTNGELTKMAEHFVRIGTLITDAVGQAKAFASALAEADANAKQAFADFEAAAEERMSAGGAGGKLVEGARIVVGAGANLATGSAGAEGPGAQGSQTAYPAADIASQQQGGGPPPGMKLNATGTRYIPDTSVSSPGSSTAGTATAVAETVAQEVARQIASGGMDLLHMSIDEVNAVIQRLQASGLSFDAAVKVLGANVNAVTPAINTAASSLQSFSIAANTITASTAQVVPTMGAVTASIGRFVTTADQANASLATYQAHIAQVNALNQQIDAFNKQNQQIASAIPAGYRAFGLPAIPAAVPLPQSAFGGTGAAGNIINVTIGQIRGQSDIDNLAMTLKNIGM